VTIYGALLAHELPEAVRLRKEPHSYVIQRMSKVDATVFGDDLRPPGVERTDRTAEQWEGLKSSLEDLRRDTWDAFVAANASPQDLSQAVHFSGALVFLTEDEIDDIFSAGCDKGYVRLFKQFPDTKALTALSMPGVAKNGTQALVYRERMYDGLGGSGAYLLLSHEGGIWKVVDHVTVWIA